MKKTFDFFSVVIVKKLLKSIEMSKSRYNTDFMKKLGKARDKANETIKMKGILTRLNKKSKEKKNEIYKEKIREQLYKSGEYHKIYKIFMDLPSYDDDDKMDKLINAVLNDDELFLLELFNWEKPNEVFKKYIEKKKVETDEDTAEDTDEEYT